MIEHEKPGNFPSSKRASKASSEPCTCPGSAGVRRAGSERNGALHNLLFFFMPWGVSDAPEAAHDKCWDKKKMIQHGYKQSREQ